MEVFGTDILAPAFLSSLLAIIVIDLVLAGDNAIVIALAARRLPTHLQKPAILWGTVGAVVVRASLTVMVVWLLGIPGLMTIGGLALFWIAWKLLTDQGEGGHQVKASSSFWGAMRTIIIADGIMGLDNMLGVAGAAHGQMLLVVLGLLISIPIMVWGSTLILKMIERFPVIVYLGGAVLVWTAAMMIMGEPAIKSRAADWPWLSWIVAPIAVAAVLVPAWMRNQNRAGQPAASAPDDATHAPFPQQPIVQRSQEIPMKYLVPVDGRPESDLAVRHVIQQAQLASTPVQVTLLSVQPKLTRYASNFLTVAQRNEFRRQRAENALAGPRELLRTAGLDPEVQIAKGSITSTIVQAARQGQIDQIVMGVRRKPAWIEALGGSISRQVLAASPVPVSIVGDGHPGTLARFGVPAGVLGLGALMLAMD